MTLPFHGRQLRIHNRIHQARRALTLTFVIDLQLIPFQRIEAHFNAFARQLRGRFEEPVVQQKSGGRNAAARKTRSVWEPSVHGSRRRERGAMAGGSETARPAQ